ncbi:MAG TPA: tripartite tricarboxylate transporter substrate binding protein [Burkholderiales bacterium]|jgi:tripartite-type tricarboxylate transporter receptor subunit TctC|nr:tripartite tricarboxylate transporter substrate binding protein [Burkholderiales bacterium]
MNRFTAFLISFLVAGAAWAQAYPTRAVRVVVPWPPGQATDIAARVVAQKLQESLGQPFVIDNKPGAGGSIGTDIVAKSAGDGYTLLAASSGPVSIMPSLQKVPYDPLKDLQPVSLMCVNAYALVTRPDFPASNAKEFVALLRANPDKFTFSSSGTGATAHLVAELFNSMAGIKARHVPYKGSAPALTDIMNGQIDYTLETIASVASQVRAGRLKMLGVSFARGSAAFPEAPPLATAAELPGYDIGAWIGYAAAPGTPREVVARLSAEVQKAIQASDVKERFTTLGLEPRAMSPEEMGAFLRKEQARYADIIKSANIKVE